MSVLADDDPRHAWLVARWRRMAQATRQAAPEVATWAWRQLSGTQVGAALALRFEGAPVPMEHGADAAELDRVYSRKERASRGQVFTPEPLADLLARLADVGEVAGWPDPRVLDPACGDGRLLVAVARARVQAGWTVAEALRHLVGWDIDPAAVFTARAALVAWALEQEGALDLPDLPDLQITLQDSLDAHGAPDDLIERRGVWSRGVGAVIANPPYVEAKRMAGPHGDLRDRLRARLPGLTGAWDLYLAFALLAARQAGEGGHVVLLVPNKVLQARYAASFRQQVRQDADLHLRSLVDLGTCKPRPFPGTGVYPVVVHLQRGPSAPLRAARIDALTEVGAPSWLTMSASALDRVGGEGPWFVPRRTWSHLEPLWSGPTLDDVAVVRSTCSFHAKGLRERFVTEQRPSGSTVYPYLGGPSRTRRTEVSSFRVRWAGWWLQHDADALRTLGNALPPLHETFLRPKVIWCQHGVRLRVVADPEGRFVTKDVYPVAWPTVPGWTVHHLTALLSSTVFTALYNSVFHGIVCGSETFHYLPVHLRCVPVPDPTHAALHRAAALAETLGQGTGPVDTELWRAMDQHVSQAYGITEAARQDLVQEHLVRVGAKGPG